jgi:hypothetical protein
VKAYRIDAPRLMELPMDADSFSNAPAGGPLSSPDSVPSLPKRLRRQALLHRFAQERAWQKEHRLVILNAHARGAWDSVGALKRFLLDDLTSERNTYAQAVVREMRQQRPATGGWPMTARQTLPDRANG